jgi:hypothetical protein
MKKAGFFIIIMGLILTIFTAFTFFSKKKAVDNGTAKITSTQTHHLKFSPLIGILVFGIGGAILLISPKRPKLKTSFNNKGNLGIM